MLDFFVLLGGDYIDWIMLLWLFVKMVLVGLIVGIFVLVFGVGMWRGKYFIVFFWVLVNS